MISQNGRIFKSFIFNKSLMRQMSSVKEKPVLTLFTKECCQLCDEALGKINDNINRSEAKQTNIQKHRVSMLLILYNII